MKKETQEAEIEDTVCKEEKEVKTSVKSAGGLKKTPQSGSLSIFLCWLVYTSAYLGRYSYSSNVISVMNFYNVSHSSAGLVTSCFFLAYGIGQLINGLLCKRYNKKIMITLSLAISSVINLSIFFGAQFVFFKYLWMLNGAAQSILWSSLISVLSLNLDENNLAKATVVMSMTVPVGTFLSYGLSAVESVFDGFKYSFLIGASIQLICSIVWFVFYDKAFKNSVVKFDNLNENSSESERKIKFKYSYYAVAMFSVIAIAIIACNIIKDGLTSWVPSILNEKFFLNEGLSVIITVTLPLLGMVGAFVNTGIVKKLQSYVSVIVFYFSGSSVCILLVVLIPSISMSGMVILFGIISLLMYAVNNFVTSLLPLYMRSKINSGMFAGVFNAFGYIGSTLSSYGLGKVADACGWSGVFYMLLCISFGVASISLIYEIICKTSKKSQFDIL